MRDKTVYIAGKITGLDDFQTRFAEAETHLRSLGAEKIINPCCMSNSNLTHEQYMQICYAMIDVSDCVYVLNNWEESDGATREYLYAVSKCKEIIWQKENVCTESNSNPTE